MKYGIRESGIGERTREKRWPFWWSAPEQKPWIAAVVYRLLIEGRKAWCYILVEADEGINDLCKWKIFHNVGFGTILVIVVCLMVGEMKDPEDTQIDWTLGLNLF